MKQILFAAFLLCVALSSARADIIVPKPTQLVVSNLSAFPKLKFTIAIGENATAQPLEENKTYEFKTTAQLFVEDADTKPRIWATVKQDEPRGHNVRILVKKVRHSRKGVEVLYDTEDTTSPSRHPHPSAFQPGDYAPQFALMGLGFGGLVLLARRKGA